jgi:hypothetical protein
VIIHLLNVAIHSPILTTVFGGTTEVLLQARTEHTHILWELVQVAKFTLFIVIVLEDIRLMLHFIPDLAILNIIKLKPFRIGKQVQQASLF